MAPWLVVWFVVGIVSTVAVLACLIALLRHLLVLGRTVQQLQDEVQPIADELVQGGRNGRARTSPPSASVRRARPVGEGPGVESRGAEAPHATC